MREAEATETPSVPSVPSRESRKDRRARLAREAAEAVAGLREETAEATAPTAPTVETTAEAPTVTDFAEAAGEAVAAVLSAPEADAGADARRAAVAALTSAVTAASALRASGNGTAALATVREAAALAREAGVGGVRATYADRGLRDPATGRRAVSLYGILRDLVTDAGSEGADRASLVSGLRTVARKIESENGATGAAAIPDARFADRVRLFFRAAREAESFVSTGGTVGRKVTVGETRGIREAAGNGRLYAAGFLPSGEKPAVLA